MPLPTSMAPVGGSGARRSEPTRPARGPSRRRRTQRLARISLALAAALQAVGCWGGSDLEASSPWVLQDQHNPNVAQIFVAVLNTSGEDRYLVGVRSAAGAVELRDIEALPVSIKEYKGFDGDAPSLPVPARSLLDLTPTSAYLAIQLENPRFLERGETIPMEAVFANGEVLAFNAKTLRFEDGIEVGESR